MLSNYIIHIYPNNDDKLMRIDFSCDLKDSCIINLLCMPKYFIYQVVLGEYQHISPEELKKKFPKFHLIPSNKPKKKWFFFKLKKDLLFLPENKNLYPHVFGNFFYYFTESHIDKNIFTDWFSNTFSKRADSIEDAYVGRNLDHFKCINDSDYFIISTYDHLYDLTIVTSNHYSKEIINYLEKFNFNDFAVNYFNKSNLII